MNTRANVLTSVDTDKCICFLSLPSSTLAGAEAFAFFFVAFFFFVAACAELHASASTHATRNNATIFRVGLQWSRAALGEGDF